MANEKGRYGRLEDATCGFEEQDVSLMAKNDAGLAANQKTNAIL